MCGDKYPLELVVGMLLYGRKYEYTYRKEVVFFAFTVESQNFAVSLKVVSYHSALALVRKEGYHGCIVVYSMEREASYKVMTAFVPRSNIKLFHVLGISGLSSRSQIAVQKFFELNELAKIKRDELEAREVSKTRDTIDQSLFCEI